MSLNVFSAGQLRAAPANRFVICALVINLVPCNPYLVGVLLSRREHLRQGRELTRAFQLRKLSLGSGQPFRQARHLSRQATLREVASLENDNLS